MWMPSWLIVVLVLAGALIILIRSSDSIYILSYIKDRFFYIFLIAIFLFFAISLTQIHAKYNINLMTKDGIFSAGKIYWSWLSTVFSNVGKIGGYAAKQDWFGTNLTNVTK